MAEKPLIEKIAEAPATALDVGIQKTEHMAASLQNQKQVAKTREYWHALGPGLTTGASDDDPSGIATYSQTGAKYGYQLLWLAVFTFPLMAIVQEMCARLGLVTGRGLAGNIRRHFSRRVLYACTLLLFTANSFNIGADLGAMAKATQLIWPSWNFGFLVFAFAFFTIGMMIFTPYVKYAKYLKWLALALFTYVVTAFLADIDWGELLAAAVTPTLQWNKDQLLLVAAIFGTTISPYLFFWQTSQEVENEIEDGKTNLHLRHGTDPEALSKMRFDVWNGMLLSNLVMFFIIATCAAVLFKNGITEINTAADAAAALEPLAGEAAKFLFAIGIIGTGLLALPVLAGSASYAVSESFGWRRSGLHRNLRQARPFYGVIMISIFVGLAINFLGIDPIKALIYSAVINALVAPVVLALIVLLSSNKKLMGEWANGVFTRVAGWLVVGLMSLVGLAAIISFF